MSCVYSKVPAESRFGREPVSEEEKSAFNEVVKKLESIPVR